MTGEKPPRSDDAEGFNPRSSSKLIDWVLPHLRDAPPYAAVTPPDVLAERLGIPLESIVKLDANENPYGPSPKALAAIAAARTYHEYPDPEQRRVRQALAEYVGYTPQWLIAGAGSDELVDLCVRLFVPPGEAIVNFPPTFGMYPFLADVQGAHVIDVVRRADYSLDLDASIRAAHQARLVFAVSPNNPTGTLTTPRELDALLETGRPVVVDEAYAEFSGQSCIDLVRERPNLIVMRTLSKWAGLAGLRVGFMVADPDLIEVVLRVKQPYNINTAAEAATLASLADREFLQTRIDAIVRERGRLETLLAELPGVEVTPSRSNFVLCRLEGVEAREVHSRLRERGIMLRYFDTDLLRNHIRISAGRPEQTDIVLRELGIVLAELRETSHTKQGILPS
ncbi:MAG TPA: histidinol-phosphate transaminase [Dehalococcoidia bacterium]|nr:histidinol-phosphate transaminase [Dehalococcoidia bacterium]